MCIILLDILSEDLCFFYLEVYEEENQESRIWGSRLFDSQAHWASLVQLQAHLYGLFYTVIYTNNFTDGEKKFYKYSKQKYEWYTHLVSELHYLWLLLQVFSCYISAYKF